MDNLDVSQIVDPGSQQPLLGPSVGFIQNATKEAITGVCRSLMGDTLYGSSSTIGIAISGCTFNGPGTIIFNGFIFYNEELYYFPGQTGLNTFSNVPVFVADTYDDPAIGPILFTDGVLKSVHYKRRLKIVDQVSGTGLFDLSSLLSTSRNKGTFGLLSTFSTTGSTQQTVTGATYTTPVGIVRNFKLTFYGNVVFTAGGVGSIEGAKLAIRNSTTSTDISVNYAEVNGSAGTNAAIFQIPFYIKMKVANVPVGTTFIGTVQRATVGSADVTIQNGYWEVEEY